MAATSLHPLARQALVLSGRTDCYGWAWGLTKYLAFRDPDGCVLWTLEFVRPRVEAAEVIRSSMAFLEGVLADAQKASLHEIETFAELPWSHRFLVPGANPLARLIWAAMGVAALAQPALLSSGDLPNLLQGDEGPTALAEKAVWSQCATGLHLLAEDHADIPMAVARAFTKSVCHRRPPAEATTLQRLKWKWKRLAYAVAVLRDERGDFHVMYESAEGGRPLYSGPFASLEEVEERLELLKHGPMTVRFRRTL